MQRYINQDANILKYFFDRTHIDVKIDENYKPFD